MEIDKQLYAEIKEYCELNGLKPRDFVHNILKKAFMEEKYGKAPAVIRKSMAEQPKIIEVPSEIKQNFEENTKKTEKQSQSVENTVESEIKQTETAVKNVTRVEKNQTVKKRKL